VIYLNPLTTEEEKIIKFKGTEPPFSGDYDDFFIDGTYFCKQCSYPLFTSKSKFDSGCGWPSFDDTYPNAIKRETDKDRIRTEILCSNCLAHLGHVFEGEQLTDKNTRHCVNSISIKFIPTVATSNIESIYLGGGCFWCVDAAFRNREGISNVEVGYAGGATLNPTYEQVSLGDTGHAEVTKIEYDNTKINLTKILKIFFKIHDPTTLNRQGNDVGSQYRSVIFFTTIDQQDEIENFIKDLPTRHYENNQIITHVLPLIKYFKAEEYHQDYYTKNPHQGYCEYVIKPKLDKIMNV
jgi:peptide methionine sulfoxide reductase msrA/msrB